MATGLEQLAASSPGPDRAAYTTDDAYLLDWYTWRALRRDGRLSDAENAASTSALVDCIRRGDHGGRVRPA